MSTLVVKDLCKIYESRYGKTKYQALDNVSFTVEKGEYIAVMGESGSGKTTLLNMLAGLDDITSGSVLLEGMDLKDISDSKMAKFRRENLGFVSGGTVTVISEINGNMIVNVKDSRVAIGKDMANHIMV